MNRLKADPITGDFFADLYVEEKVSVELKVALKYNSKDNLRLINKLKSIAIRIGLPINFGRENLEFKRFVYNRELNLCLI